MHTATLYSNLPLLILLDSALHLMVTVELIASIHLILLGKYNGSGAVSLPHIFCALCPIEMDLFFIYLC